ncbi:hypothetical protein C8Q74DRAFT_1298985, partial [Fomes fomentarius]
MANNKLSGRVETLCELTRAVRLAFVGNLHKINRVDAAHDTRFLEQWTGMRENFQALVNASEGSAAMLAETIEVYVILPQYCTTLEDVTFKFNALNQLQALGRNPKPHTEVKQAPAEVTAWEHNLARARERRAQDNGIIAGILSVIQDMRQNLYRMRELLDSICNELIRTLTYEVRRYLSAAQANLVNPSLENQFTFRNASMRISSSSTAWKERAVILSDRYAKAL